MNGTVTSHTPIQSRVRRGKCRKHPQGYSIDIFRGDESLLATVYGGSVEETDLRAHIAVQVYADYYEVRS